MRPFPPKCCKAFGSTFSWHWSPDQELVSALTSGKGFQVLCPSSCTGALQSRETWMAGWWDGYGLLIETGNLFFIVLEALAELASGEDQTPGS